MRFFRRFVIGSVWDVHSSKKRAGEIPGGVPPVLTASMVRKDGKHTASCGLISVWFDPSPFYLAFQFFLEITRDIVDVIGVTAGIAVGLRG